jgi:hypothetical protein
LSSQPIRKKATRKQPVRHSLNDLGGLLREMGIVYRAVRAGKMPHDEGRSLTWILDKMRSAVEAMHLERIESRLAEIEAAAERMPNGHQGNNRQIGYAH